MWTENLALAALVRVSPILVPTLNPANVGTTALAAGLVRSRMQEPSLVGAVMVQADVLVVMYWSGRWPQSIVMLPVVCVFDVTLAPPVNAWSSTLSNATGGLLTAT